MHPTTYEYLTKAHIADLQPDRNWPEDDAPSVRISRVQRVAGRIHEQAARKLTIVRRVLARAAAS